MASNGAGHDATDAVDAVRLLNRLRLRVSELRGRNVNRRPTHNVACIA